MADQPKPLSDEEARLLFEVSRMYHQSLRSEILYKMRVQDQVGYVKILLFAATVALAIYEPSMHMDPSIEPYMYVLPLGLAVLLDLVIIQNLRTLLDAGRFLHEQVEGLWMAPLKDRMGRAVGRDDVEFWEERVLAIRKRTSRWHFNAADVAQMFLTVVIGLVCSVIVSGRMVEDSMTAAIWSSRALLVLLVLYLALVAALYFPMLTARNSRGR